MPNKSGGISELRISLAVSAQQLVLVESYYALGHFMSKSDGAMTAMKGIFPRSRVGIGMDGSALGKEPLKILGEKNAFLRFFLTKIFNGGSERVRVLPLVLFFFDSKP